MAGLKSTIHGGSERRSSPRMPASYPVRLRYAYSTEDCLESFSQTRNVSSDGLLIASVEALEPGTQVNVSIALPLGSDASIPSAQLDAPALVLRSESFEQASDGEYPHRTALQFLQKPIISTSLTMFD